MAYAATGIGLAILSNVVLIFFARKYSSDQDSNLPMHVSLNATKIGKNQLTLEWTFYSTKNVSPSEIRIQTNNVRDSVNVTKDVTNSSIEQYLVDNLDEGADYLICLMAKDGGNLIGTQCINVTTLSHADEKVIPQSRDVITLSSILGFSCFFGVMLTIYTIYGRVIRSRLQGYTRHMENHASQSTEIGIQT